MANSRFSVSNLLDGLIAAPGNTMMSAPNQTGISCGWTNGSKTVTRASGSFIEDRVGAQALLGSTLAARFPATTRVERITGHQSLETDKACTAGGSGTDPGNFTAAFGVNENSNFLMRNLANGGKYVPWVSVGAGSAVSMGFDTISTANKHIFGALGCSGEFTTISVYSGSSPTSMPNFKGTLGNARDNWAVFAPTTDRYWTCTVNVSGSEVAPIAIGQIWIGSLTLDLGVTFAAGSAFEEEWMRRRHENMSGHPFQVLHESGPVGSTAIPRRRFVLTYDNIGGALFGNLQNNIYRASKTPLVYVDELDQPHHVQFIDPFRYTRGLNTYSAQLTLEVLP